MPNIGRTATHLGLQGRYDPAVGRRDRSRDRATETWRLGHSSLRAQGRAARLGLLRWDDPAVGRRDGAEIARLKGHDGWVTALCVLKDGRLASGSTDKTIRLWDVASSAEIASLEALERYFGDWIAVSVLCSLADGRLASGSGERSPAGGRVYPYSGDWTVRLWHLATGTETARLEGHSMGVNALCLLADGGLASGSDDCTIRLWDVTTGAETARLEGHFGELNGPLLDGRVLLPHGFRPDVRRAVCRRPPRAGFDRRRSDGAFQRSRAIAENGTQSGRGNVTSRSQSIPDSTRQRRPDAALDEASGGPSRLGGGSWRKPFGLVRSKRSSDGSQS